MAKCKLNVRVFEGKGDERKSVREFLDVEVNLFDTLQENLAMYTEEILNNCLTGTSGMVAIQTASRDYASEIEDDGNFSHDDEAVVAFIQGYELSESSGRGSKAYVNAPPHIQEAAARKSADDKILREWKKSQS